MSTYPESWALHPPAPGDRDHALYVKAQPAERERLRKLAESTEPPELDVLGTAPDPRDEPDFEADTRSVEEQARAIAAAGTAERLGAVPLGALSADPPKPPLLGFLDHEHTILYGTGGVGKGSLAAHWIVQLAAIGERVLIADYENHPGEWARRGMSLGGASVRDGVFWVGPYTAAWGGEPGGLYAQRKELRALAVALDATYLVVDSIVPACGGGDALKAEAASQYAAALQYIGLPTLSLGHITKVDAMTYPFGSVFWHNLARLTWSLVKDGERASLVCRKHNNYPFLGRHTVTMTWYRDQLGEVALAPYLAVLADRIDELLTDGPLRVSQIVDRLNDEREDDAEKVKADSVRAALRRGLTSDPKRYAVDGKADAAEWSRV